MLVVSCANNEDHGEYVDLSDIYIPPYARVCVLDSECRLLSSCAGCATVSVRKDAWDMLHDQMRCDTHCFPGGICETWCPTHAVCSGGLCRESACEE